MKLFPSPAYTEIQRQQKRLCRLSRFKNKIKINILKKERDSSKAIRQSRPMLAQYACRQLFNHENHTLIFAGINTRIQRFKYYITMQNEAKSCCKKK